MDLILNNNKCKLEGSAKVLMKLIDHPRFAIRVPGAFYSPQFRKRQWDGFYRAITERGYFATGKLVDVIDVLTNEFNEDIRVYDNRLEIKPGKIPTSMADGSILRDYQIECLRSIKNNEVSGNIIFPRGVVAAATNAGKTIIAAGIHKMYNDKTLFLINSRELLNDALIEIPKFLGEENVGWIIQKEIKWAPFMVVMVPTAINRASQIAHKVSDYHVALVDECDLATSKSYTKVLSWFYNTYVQLGLSGSAFKHKDKTKNDKLKGLFGDIIYDISNRQLMNMGYSSEVKVSIIQGYEGPGDEDYSQEYKYGIILNKRRNNQVVKRVKFHVNKDRLPILVMVKNHKHVKVLYNRLSKASNIMGGELFGLRIAWVHHKNKDRFDIVKKFKEGKIDILVGSYILKRGKNFPLMKVLINASGGESANNVLQILGRATRFHESKKFTLVDDFWDQGKYLKRHSKRRLLVYKNEKLQIKEFYQR